MTILLVMAKAPEPGLVKTRLCPPATPHQAAAIAAAALLDTLDAVRATPDVTPVLAYSGRLADAERADEIWHALSGWSLIRQRGTGFGERLAHAHADAAALAPGAPLLQIGMDSPQVRPATLAAAVARLSDHDAVLGPAVDGGWWALGLRDPAHAVALRRVPMSTPDTARLTREALSARGLRVADALTLSDVDTWDDALSVARATPGSRFAAAVVPLSSRARPRPRATPSPRARSGEGVVL